MAVASCAGNIAQDEADKGARQKRLGVAGRRLQDGIEIRQRRGEFMERLIDHGAQHTHLFRRVRLGPPWRQRGLGFTIEARIRPHASLFDSQASDAQCAGEIFRFAGEIGFCHAKVGSSA